MQHFFVKQEQIEDNKVKIIDKDVNHIKNVLRCKINEKIEVSVLENGEKYLVEILELNENYVMCNIINKVEETAESNIDINIIQGLPKADKMELIIQKSTELGVKEITPIELERSIVKLNSKDAEKKLTRWQTIAETAAKQCGRNTITKINNLCNLKNINEIIKDYDLVIVAYENEKEISLKDVINEIKFKNLKQELSFAAINNFEINTIDKMQNKSYENKNIKIGIIIGPEGGLTEKEIDSLKSLGVKSVSLGKRILRTETVAIVLASIIMYELGDFGEI